MKVTLKTSDKVKEFENKSVIIIGNDESCDFVVNADILVKLVYYEKYDNYVIVNSNGNKNVLCNGKSFSKAIVPTYFSLNLGNLTILATVEQVLEEIPAVETKVTSQVSSLGATPKAKTGKVSEIFNNATEKNRIAIVREIGSKIEELKASVKLLNNTNLFLNIALVVLSVVCSFGMTNFFLG